MTKRNEKSPQALTPELEKINEISGESQKIGQFLEWLEEQKITLSDWTGTCEDCDGDNFILAPISETKEQLLANYFSIDLAKAEKERQALLDSIRAGQ